MPYHRIAIYSVMIFSSWCFSFLKFTECLINSFSGMNKNIIKHNWLRFFQLFNIITIPFFFLSKSEEGGREILFHLVTTLFG